MGTSIHTVRSGKRSLVLLVVCVSIGALTLAVSSSTHAQQTLNAPARSKLVCQGGLSIANAVSPCKTTTVHSPAPTGAKLGDSCTARIDVPGLEKTWGTNGIVVALIPR